MAKQTFTKKEDQIADMATPDTSGGEAMISYMKALPFDHIIGAPLMACIKAQQASAQATWEAIHEMGFDKSDKSAGEEEVAMVSFLFQQGGFTRKITVPLLTLIPIPYMQIDYVDLKFRADMSTSSDGELTAKYSNTMDSQAARTSKYNVTNEIDINLPREDRHRRLHEGCYPERCKPCTYPGWKTSAFSTAGNLHKPLH